ncbi:hypothetical protein MPSEU_000137800 [Mayamaea pseudoterrestris]|nr:hypothetical protein MPSEU_000137800 [Mayamaea pseudoterrestris]
MPKRSSKRGSLLDEMAEAAQRMAELDSEGEDELDEDYEDMEQGYDKGETVPDYGYEEDVYGYEHHEGSESIASYTEGSMDDMLASSNSLQPLYEGTESLPEEIGSSAHLRYAADDVSGLSPMTPSTPSSSTKSIQRLGKFLSRRDNSIRLSGSSGGRTIKSAPLPGGSSSELLMTPPLTRRPTVGSPDEIRTSARRGGRRPHVYLRPSIQSQLSALSDDQNSSMGSMNHRRRRHQSITQSTRFSIQQHRHSRMSNLTNSSSGGSSRFNMSDAVHRLGDGSSADWDNVLAAASVVAASASVPSLRTTQFGQDEAVLCMLTLLNITNHEDDPMDFSIDPVNMYGYSAREGKTEPERNGPYNFVLCTVVTVHFDEDERYYTVRRHDTGTEQRADPQWMEPCAGGSAGLEAAEEAAKRTTRAVANTDEELKKDIRMASRLELVMEWWDRFVVYNLIPWFVDTRKSAKTVATHVLTGERGYGCRIKLTCINLLVFCSFIYLMIEPFTYAFLPPSKDRASAVLELVVWCVLVVELFFEYLTRPWDYNQAVKSERAFQPSIARHVDSFHLFCESLALILFIPEMPCILRDRCDAPGSVAFSMQHAAMLAVTGSTRVKMTQGRFVIGLMFLRMFALIRHWKQMWIRSMFDEDLDGQGTTLLQTIFVGGPESGTAARSWFRKSPTLLEDETDKDAPTGPTSAHDRQLKKAANIGTSLVAVNTHRSLALLMLMVAVYPVIYTLGSSNQSSDKLVKLLAQNNLLSNSTDECDYLRNAVFSWVESTAQATTDYKIDEQGGTYDIPLLLWAQVLPVRCDWQEASGVITACPESLSKVSQCEFWATFNPLDPSLASSEYFAERLGARVEGIVEYTQVNEDIAVDFGLGTADFQVTAFMEQGDVISFTMLTLFILMVCMLVLTLSSLAVMRGDIARLVLEPLRRMLKIVVRYAENPLAHADALIPEGGDQLGNYETEQLITAISKIADLLRKCWGVAGAGIISANLARTEAGATVVFNPTVPGKRVYALFGFVAVNDFSRVLDLGNDVLILINDVAKVVHEEVYRWALGDSGQCNKNLGGAFLMVFRIGDFTDVHDKKKRATDVVFNTSTKVTRSMKAKMKQMKKRNATDATEGQVALASLPGIQAFTDRALLGLLKSFAGIHRDRKLQSWRQDFRLGGGVGAYFASAIYGMDAGWAVEGAVGSEHKIDATYLSPHVNMASRMMSASKQYGVTLLMSQAVEELMSRAARQKLRHLDTVFVKGSSVPQRIFTYDARYEGVNFFLFERPPELADLDAELYSSAIWETDQDLKAMRQHVTADFMHTFKEGVDLYLEGKWESACKILREADNIMIRTVLEEGYIDLDNENMEDQLFDETCDDEEVIRVRNSFGDGACRCLIQYMQRRNRIPPGDWEGVRQLMSK